MATPLVVPKLGLTMTSGTVSTWYAADGDTLTPGDIVYLLGTDKTETEIEAEASGILHQAVPAGTTLAPGDVAGWLLAPGEAPPAPEATGAPAAAPAAPATPATPAEPAGRATSGAPAAPAGSDAGNAIPAKATGDAGEGAGSAAGARNGSGRLLSSPFARRTASRLGVDLAAVRGTGPGGRVVAADVRDAAARGTGLPAPGTGEAAGAGGQEALASPVARRLAERLGVDLRTAVGTGPGGRVRLDDVLVAAGQLRGDAAPSAGGDDGGRSGGPAAPTLAPGDAIALQGVRGVIADRMHESLATMAQLTLVRDVAVDRLVALRTELREQAGPGEPVPSVTDLVVKATALALRRHPLLNATVAEGEIHLLVPVDVGLAVATDAGLLVPVVRAADELPLRAIGAVARDLAERARLGRLSPADMEAPTFTVSALGAAGIDAFTPIVNPPNVAILGVGRIRDGVRWEDDAPVRSATMTLSLTVDHRAVDGAPGAEFLATLADLLDRPLGLLG